MPRYFFHTRNAHAFSDETGTELTDDDAARAEAIITTGSVLRDLGADFWSGQDWSMQVVSHTGETICELLVSARPQRSTNAV
jgi:hypothetical protein